MLFKKGQKVYHVKTGKQVWEIIRDEGGVKVVITDGRIEISVLRGNLIPVENKEGGVCDERLSSADSISNDSS